MTEDPELSYADAMTAAFAGDEALYAEWEASALSGGSAKAIS